MMAQLDVLSDEAIQQNVRRELEWRTCIPETTIGVVVAHGLVTLSGTVGTDAAKVVAQDAAHRVRGVLDVVNHIVVQAPGGGGPSDAEVARAVRRALECAPLISHQRIETTVCGGWVTLDGEVEHHSQHARVERVVRRLAGVRGVSNRIAIVTSPADPAVVHKAIEAALQRLTGNGVACGGAAPGSTQHITVAIEGSTVTLSGRVDSWAEKRAAVVAVEQVTGVHAVVDHLCIETAEIDS